MPLLQDVTRRAAQAVEGARGVDWSSLVSLDTLALDAIRILVILVLAFVSYRVVKILTRRLQREVAEEDPLIKRMREQRAQTIGSLLNSIAFVVIGAVTLLMVLGTFIQIGPLLATAGIAGLAISFGAQSLVKDIISGIFILLEGQFGIGDVVRVQDTAGIVERITLRTTVLRDVHGVVHVIPNGEITLLSNLTKSWSKAVLDIGVAYKEDVDRVIALLKEVGGELRADPDWRATIMEEPEVPGVQEFADSAVLVRIQFKTLPLKQWDVAREFRRRIKKRFDAEGIEIPFPHTTLYWGEGQAPFAPAADGGTDRARAEPAGSDAETSSSRD